MPYADMIAYCLMPNHFHLMLRANESGVKTYDSSTKINVQKLSQGLGSLISSYTQALNIQRNRRGGLFAHRTKAKLLNGVENDYLLNCFLYIHQNPIEAAIVEKLEDWEFSSYLDYIGRRKGTLVDVNQGLELLNISAADIKYIIDFKIPDISDENFM
ncbi:MAG: hypothetical protein QMB37_07105 [Paludibacteraceae bacterium]